ncbi:hypothetical protein ACP3W1_28820, partial [Salmonella enterica]|uniref:hypothetical protein n=1 Tax=Salmonella enterica TaxID=28901 RepID=UPI003CEF56A7
RRGEGASAATVARGTQDQGGMMTDDTLLDIDDFNPELASGAEDDAPVETPDESDVDQTPEAEIEED